MKRLPQTSIVPDMRSRMRVQLVCRLVCRRVSRHATLVLFGILVPSTQSNAQQSIPATPQTTRPLVSTSSPQIPDATVVATNEYRRNGTARSVQEGDFLVVPYGKTQPTLTCAILRTCLIRLQAGEHLTGGPALGDSERWLVAVLASGPRGDTPLVTVKPTDCDITTDVVLPTDRHLYIISLDTPPCNTKERTGSISPNPTSTRVESSNNPSARYTRYLAFYYPDEISVPAVPIRSPTLSLASKSPAGIALEQLNFAYSVDKDRRFPWVPAQIFDDGAHTYIHVPAQALRGPAPALFLMNDDGSRAILNYAIMQDYYVADRVLHRAQLVLAEGGNEHRLTLTNTRTAQ
jgi:type IV secretion system protein VirB9